MEKKPIDWGIRVTQGEEARVHRRETMNSPEVKERIAEKLKEREIAGLRRSQEATALLA